MKINDSIIQQYLDGDLSEDEVREFEKQIASDPELQRELEAYQKARRAVETAALKKDLDQIFDQDLSDEHTDQPVPRRYWALAASLLLLIGLGGALWWQLNTQPAKQLYSDFYRPDRGLPSLMGGEDHKLAPWEDPMVDYKRGQYNEAALGFSKALGQHPANDTVLLYLGLSEMELDRLDKGLNHLQSVKKNSGNLYQKAQWYKALLWLKKGEIEKSRKLLLEINAQDDHPYSQKAGRLLLELEHSFEE